MHFLQDLAPRVIPNLRRAELEANSSRILMAWGWIDGKRAAEKSKRWIWTDGTRMCNLQSVVDELLGFEDHRNNCLELGIFRLADRFEPHSRIQSIQNCGMKLSYLCKKEVKPCLSDPGLPCSLMKKGSKMYFTNLNIMFHAKIAWKSSVDD